MNNISFSDCDTFQKLHDLLCEELMPIYGIGPLMIYDTATRLGFYLKLKPDYVYLHAGTKQGAKNLGLDYTKEKISHSDFPKDLQELEPYEIEDCLCIYKTELKNCNNLPKV